MDQEKGFSVLELLVAVGVILILGAIAVPRFLGSRESADQAAAAASIHAIVVAQTNYAVTYPQAGYADTLSKLGPPVSNHEPNADHAGLLDEVLACPKQPCMKSGYLYQIEDAKGSPVTSYHLGAMFAGGQGTLNQLCTDETGLIKRGDECKQGSAPNSQVTKP
jgi:prepilin-type N-terminal cleavage/methylation domain-containing protein